jgi:hypothetical protein
VRGERRGEEEEVKGKAKYILQKHEQKKKKSSKTKQKHRKREVRMT